MISAKVLNTNLDRDLLFTKGEVSASCCELLSSCEEAARASACFLELLLDSMVIEAPTVDTVLDVSI